MDGVRGGQNPPDPPQNCQFLVFFLLLRVEKHQTRAGWVGPQV